MARKNRKTSIEAWVAAIVVVILGVAIWLGAADSNAKQALLHSKALMDAPTTKATVSGAEPGSQPATEEATELVLRDWGMAVKIPASYRRISAFGSLPWPGGQTPWRMGSLVLRDSDRSSTSVDIYLDPFRFRQELVDDAIRTTEKIENGPDLGVVRQSLVEWAAPKTDEEVFLAAMNASRDSVKQATDNNKLAVEYGGLLFRTHWAPGDVYRRNDVQGRHIYVGVSVSPDLQAAFVFDKDGRIVARIEFISGVEDILFVGSHIVRQSP